MPHKNRPDYILNPKENGQVLQGLPSCPPSAANKEDGEDGLSWLDTSNLLRAFRKRWLPALALGLILGCGAAAGAWFLFPMKYSVTAQVRIHVNRPRILNPQAGGESEYNLFQKAQQALIVSRPVIQAAVDSLSGRNLEIFKGNSNPVDWLGKEIKTDFKLGPETLQITFLTDNPEDGKAFLDALVVCYLEETVEKDLELRRRLHQQMLGYLKRYETELSSQQKRVQELARTKGSKEGTEVHRLYLNNTLARVLDERIKTRTDLKNVKAELEVKKTLLRNPSQVQVSEDAIDTEMSRDPQLVQLQVEKTRADLLLAKTTDRIVAGASSPVLARYREQVEAAQTALEKKREELKPQIAARLARQAQRELDISRNLLLQRQNYLENYECALVEEQEQLEKQKANTNVNQVDLEMFKENYVPLEEVVKRLSVEAQMTGVELEAPPRVEPLQPAVVDLDWAQKRAKQVTALAGLVGLALGMGLVTLWEARARRLSGDQEVLQGLGFPIVGLVPRIPRLGDNYSHLKGQAPTGAIVAFTEHMDITRTRFLHLTRLGNAQVIMVASAGPGEGKTMVCCHLAASLVGAGRKTVLVDGDMRRPSVHRVLGLPDSPGLAEVLRGETALGNALFSTPIANLWVIPAGRWNRETAQALATGNIAELFGYLRHNFDFALVDSPPVLPLADSLLLGQHCDGVIFSTMEGISQIESVQAAAHRISELDIRVFGAIINGANLDRTHRYYHEVPCSRSPGSSLARKEGL